MALENVESVSALTAVQRLMLVNVVAAGGSGAHVDQIHLRLEGALDPVHFQAAWSTVLARHAALRTAFFWEGLSAPMQVVRNSVELPWSMQDCRHLAQPQIDAFVEGIVREQEQAPFDLARAPLMRFLLLRTGEDRYEFVWTYLVLLLDGWSIATVVREVFALHEALRAGEALALPPARPFGDYLRWLAARDEGEAERFWRQALDRSPAPTPIPVPGGRLPAAIGESSACEEHDFEPGEVERLRSAAQSARVTLGTLVQAAWAVVLGACGSTDDVLFGLGSSGRPADLDAVEGIVGQFTANVPVRVRIPRDQPVGAWLQACQRAQLDSLAFEHAPLERIEQWAGLAGQRLFETIVQVHNFPLDGTFWEARGFVVTGLRKVIRANYPLALVAIPKPGLTLRLVYDGAIWPAQTAALLLAEVRRVMLSIAAGTATDVGALVDAVTAPPGLLPAVRMPPGKPRTGTAPTTPMTPLQSRIAAIWREVLGVEEIGADDNLFELGGRSVHAVRIHERIQSEALGTLSVVELFQFPTVALLAARLGSPAGAADGALADAEARGRQRVDATRDRRDRLRQARLHDDR